MPGRREAARIYTDQHRSFRSERIFVEERGGNEENLLFSFSIR